MKSLIIRLLITSLALLALTGHLVGTVTVGWEGLVLLLLAFLPWLSEFIDSFKLGKDNFEIKMREIEKKADAAMDASIRGVVRKPVLPDGRTTKTLGQASSLRRDNDPNFGKFGGKAEANGRKLSATIEKIPDEDFYRRVILRVQSIDPKKPLEGSVKFHLHNTFATPVFDEKVDKDGIAQTSIISYGVFTVGAEADNGETRLELDLASLRNPGDSFFDR